MNKETGIISDLERMPSSKNGNPRYRVVVGGEMFVTQPDSSLAYSITNYRNKKVSIDWRIIRNQKTIVSLEAAA